MNKPDCKCHGEPQYWQKQPSRPNGGYWICAVKSRERVKKWAKDNPEKRKEKESRRRRKTPWRSHHLTNDGYFDLLIEQEGKCKACGITLREYGKLFQVDHDHDCCPGIYSCGKCIRGLLCRPCNLADALV